MALKSYPYVNEPTTDVEYSQLFNPSVGSGVRTLDDFKVTADGSAMSVKVAAGFMHVRGHAFVSSAVETVNVDAGEAQPRIDIVVARLDYGATPQIQLAVVKGVAASSPTAPSLTQTPTGVFEFPLATLNIPASAVVVNSGNVSTAIAKTVADGMLSYLLTNASSAASLRSLMGIHVQASQPSSPAINDLWFW